MELSPYNEPNLLENRHVILVFDVTPRSHNGYIKHKFIFTTLLIYKYLS